MRKTDEIRRWYEIEDPDFLSSSHIVAMKKWILMIIILLFFIIFAGCNYRTCIRSHEEKRTGMNCYSIAGITNCTPYTYHETVCDEYELQEQ